MAVANISGDTPEAVAYALYERLNGSRTSPANFEMRVKESLDLFAECLAAAKGQRGYGGTGLTRDAIDKILADNGVVDLHI